MGRASTRKWLSRIVRQMTEPKYEFEPPPKRMRVWQRLWRRVVRNIRNEQLGINPS